MAFLGGVILNVMPCVLPVLTLKVFHTIEVYGDEKHNPRLHALAYAGGTTAAFAAFSLIIVALRASGEVLGWGMHFQHPPFVGALTAVIFAFGLNALGVFELNISWGGKSGHGVVGSFVNGVFAAVMSTPCTAPFLASAAGFALAADATAWVTITLFGAIGLGLAFPYVAIGFIPAVAKLLPRPGPWMVTFKHIMGFTLLGAAVWLYGALQAQVTSTSANMFLGFLLLLAAGLWAWGHFAALHHGTVRRWVVRLGIVGVLIGLGGEMLFFERAVRAQTVAAQCADTSPVVQNGKIAWRPFSAEVIAAQAAQNRPVFVDYTAEWCAACKTNERVFLETDLVRGTLLETNILPMQADMTNDNPEIQSWLDKLTRDGKPISGIPAYAIYMPDQSVDVLPVTITAELVAERLRLAAQRFPQVVSN